MEKWITVTVDKKAYEYPAGITYGKVAEQFQKQFEQDIVLVNADGKLKELNKEIYEDCRLEFVTTKDQAGMASYERSMTLMLLRAIYRVAGRDKVRTVSVLFSVRHGYYLEADGDFTLDETFLKEVKQQMESMVKEDLPIEKRSVHTDEAMELFSKYRMYDKEELLRYRRVSNVNLYRIGDFEDYYYGYMVPSTGYLKYFDLMLYQDGFVLLLPRKKDPKTVPPFEDQPKLFCALKEAEDWNEKLQISTVAELNDHICSGRLNELILVQEALQEQKIAKIAGEIVERKECRFVMIAGPSSSGKTTFSHRLSIQLKALGMRPHPIAVDNYFRNREQAPKDENGEYDFEALECVDMETLNRDMQALLSGKEVMLPTYNFKTGKREYRGDKLVLGKRDILILEGIHALNDKMTYSLPKESKYKIYISALTTLNVDEHNRIPTTDGRLIRRMVRDARTRGNSAADTIARWPSVRRGEENNIFPYQEEADVMFNSALVYELAVLKVQAEPLLFSIPKDTPEYQEAKRLLKFFDYFLPIGSDEVPKNSILREFIGGSCFKV